MADIELVIKIPKAIYEASQLLDVKYEDTVQIPLEVIANGIPLQKGHGRLIDADVLGRDLEDAQVNLGDALSEAFDDGLTWASEVASKLPAIIEADKGE